MKMKYYIRGLAAGVLATTILFLNASVGNQNSISDTEVIERAKALGMVEEKESLFSNAADNTDEVSSQEGSITEEDKDSEEQSESTTDTDSSEDIDPETEDSKVELSSSEEDSEVEEEKQESLEVSESEEKQENLNSSEDSANQEITFTIESGLSSRTIASMLAEKGVIEDADAFHDYIVANDSTTLMNIGEYTVEKGISYKDLLNKIIVGGN